MGYYFECPHCDRQHDFNPKPAVWYDADRISQEDAERLMATRGALLPMPSDGLCGFGTIQPTLPDRRCHECGEEGCVDCMHEDVCATCWKRMTLTVTDAALTAFWLGSHRPQDRPVPAAPGRFLTVAQCAAHIGRSVCAVRMLVAKAHIPHLRIGRRIQFDARAVDKWMESHYNRGRRL